jgi:hypothetical protein
MRASQVFAVLLAVLIANVAAAQQGPPGTRITGTVKSVDASKLVLATAKGDVALTVTPQTRLLTSQAASVSDIQPGTYLGTSNQNGPAPDTGTATEVHLGDNGPNVNSPMNNSGLIMTNGHVTRVTHTAAGEEMDIDYGQATKRRVVVPADTRVTKMVLIDASQLKPGVSVMTMTSTGPDGHPVANMVMIGDPAAK